MKNNHKSKPKKPKTKTKIKDFPSLLKNFSDRKPRRKDKHGWETFQDNVQVKRKNFPKIIFKQNQNKIKYVEI